MKIDRRNLTSTLSYRWVQFLALAAIVFVVPSVLGHPFAAGDNLIQFNPLRMLAGQIESQGHLPLWNQYIWSGTPLLAGFNAGVFFPTSWFYIFLPATLAWGLSQALPYFLASYGFYLLMREIGTSDFAARVTGLVYAYSGVMIGQGVHLDMIIGISLAPWMLLCVSRIIDGDPSGRARYAVYLAICYALVVLAGAPEAMLDELVMLVVYALVKLARSPEHWARKALWLGSAGIFALGISAAQWVPGLEFQKISQRANPTFAFVSFGAFAPQYFYSFFAPYLFGGPGALPASGYYGPFTWEEVTIYPTIGAIISFFDTIVRLLRRSLESRLVPYLFMAITGIVLALGAYTPLEALVYHIPLYGKQRLPGRNVLTLNVAVFAFFGVWLDRLLSPNGWLRSWSRWLCFLPALAIAALYITSMTSSGFLTSLLNARPTPHDVTHITQTVVFLVALIVALASGTVYFFSGRTRHARRWIAVVVLADLVAFNVFGGLGTASHISQFNSTSEEMGYVHSLIGSSSRFALYDPRLITYGELNAFGEPDLNIEADNHSIQGYSSLSLGSYENATHTHAQATFPPSLLTNPLIDTLGTKVILTNWSYLTTHYRAQRKVKLPGFYLPATNNEPTSAYPVYGISQLQTTPTATTGLFGRTMEVSGVDLNLGTSFPSDSIVRVGLIEPDGTTAWLTKDDSTQTATDTVRYSVPVGSGSKAMRGYGVVVDQLLPTNLSNPQNALVVGTGIETSQGYFALTGALTSFLTYPHYRQVTSVGNISIFDNSQAKPILQPGSGITITNEYTSPNGSLHMTVTAKTNSDIYWAEAYAPGWKVKYVGPTGQTEHSTIPNGALQEIPVPKGTWKMVAYYHPASAYVGILISLAFLVALAVLLALQLRQRRERRSQWKGTQPKAT